VEGRRPGAAWGASQAYSEGGGFAAGQNLGGAGTGRDFSFGRACSSGYFQAGSTTRPPVKIAAVLGPRHTITLADDAAADARLGMDGPPGSPSRRRGPNKKAAKGAPMATRTEGRSDRARPAEPERGAAHSGRGRKGRAAGPAPGPQAKQGARASA